MAGRSITGAERFASEGMRVVMADVDRLKRINDAEGHEAGDEAIRSVANAIRKRIRADDLLFRWGGDEFLVVMPQSPD